MPSPYAQSGSVSSWHELYHTSVWGCNPAAVDALGSGAVSRPFLRSHQTHKNAPLRRLKPKDDTSIIPTAKTPCRGFYARFSFSCLVRWGIYRQQPPTMSAVEPWTMSRVEPIKQKRAREYPTPKTPRRTNGIFNNCCRAALHPLRQCAATLRSAPLANQ